MTADNLSDINPAAVLSQRHHNEAASGVPSCLQARHGSHSSVFSGQDSDDDDSVS